MPRRAAARAVAVVAACTAVTALQPTLARGDAGALRLQSATFNGTGAVAIPDNAAPYVSVSSWNPAINDDECSAVVVAGVAAPEVFRCSFNYTGTFQPVAGVYCTGIAVSTGKFVVFMPDGSHVFEFRDMRATVDEATVHGIGSSFVDIGTGQTRTGYAEFEFASTTCDRRAKNFGRVLY